MIIDNPNDYIQPVQIGVGIGGGELKDKNVDPPTSTMYVFLEIAGPFGPQMYSLLPEEAISVGRGLIEMAQQVSQGEAPKLEIARDLPANLQQFFPPGGSNGAQH